MHVHFYLSSFYYKFSAIISFTQKHFIDCYILSKIIKLITCSNSLVLMDNQFLFICVCLCLNSELENYFYHLLMTTF